MAYPFFLRVKIESAAGTVRNLHVPSTDMLLDVLDSLQLESETVLVLVSVGLVERAGKEQLMVVLFVWAS